MWNIQKTACDGAHILRKKALNNTDRCPSLKEEMPFLRTYYMDINVANLLFYCKNQEKFQGFFMMMIASINALLIILYILYALNNTFKP